MTDYEKAIFTEVESWKREMKLPPGVMKEMTGNFQERVNRVIPEKIHKAVTAAIREMTRAVILGSQFTKISRHKVKTLEAMDNAASRQINIYSSSASAEGAVTGFGGILMGLADLPLWLTIKMKMLFEIATIYGHNTKELHERLYILYIFELTFSSQKHRTKLFPAMENWLDTKEKYTNMEEFDWKTFQLQYRDQIDLRKLLQLIPGAGAVVGAYVNYTLTRKLGEMAINSYRMRSLISA